MFIESTLFLLCVAGLTIAMLIDSTAWHIRALAVIEDRGLFISKTNIFLYGGRFFSLLYMTILAYFVDIGKMPADIILVSAIGFGIAAITNHVILGIQRNRRVFVALAATGLFLPHRPPAEANVASAVLRQSASAQKLFVQSALATFVFSLGISVPYFVAALYPDFRMTFNNLGQIINSIGMLILLLLVDAKLYRDWDAGVIAESNEAYTLSRTVGLFVAATVFALGYGTILWLP